MKCNCKKRIPLQRDDQNYTLVCGDWNILWLNDYFLEIWQYEGGWVQNENLTSNLLCNQCHLEIFSEKELKKINLLYLFSNTKKKSIIDYTKKLFQIDF